MKSDPKTHILVIGDPILDVYWHGEVMKLSPEAPVPLVSFHKEVRVPGGAANVCVNVVSLGCPTAFVGRLGTDEYGAQLVTMLSKQGVRMKGVVKRRSYQTPVKTRIVGRGQHIVRIDREHSGVVADDGAIASKISEEIRHARIVLVSDYAKGTISQRVAGSIMKAARSRGIPVLVDTKPAHIGWFKGAYVIAPNMVEAEAMTGTSDVRRAGRILQEMTGGNVLITQGPDGMTLFESRRMTHFPAQAHTVFDVVGAGDTAIAALAAGLFRGLGLASAVRTANIAAGIVVGKQGTATVTWEEIVAAGA